MYMAPADWLRLDTRPDPRRPVSPPWHPARGRDKRQRLVCARPAGGSALALWLCFAFFASALLGTARAQDAPSGPPVCEPQNALFALCTSDRLCARAFGLDVEDSEEYNRRLFSYLLGHAVARLDSHTQPGEAGLSVADVQRAACPSPNRAALENVLVLSVLRMVRVCDINEYYRLGRGCLCRSEDAAHCPQGHRLEIAPGFFYSVGYFNIVVTIATVGFAIWAARSARVLTEIREIVRATP